MVVLKGKAALGGICFGKLKYLKKSDSKTDKYTIEDVSKEIERYEKAKKKALSKIQMLYDKALKEVGEDNAMIFEIHKMMIEDLEYNEFIKNLIENERINTEHAIQMAQQHFSDILLNLNDDYMKGRVDDIQDISTNLLQILKSEKGFDDKNIINEPVIIAAEELSPSETMQLDKKNILAFAIQKGTMSSHTAILSRTMNIPAIIKLGNEFNESYDGKYVIVDGFNGVIYIDPDEKKVKELKELKKHKEHEAKLLNELLGKESITIDGKKIELCANIGSTEDVASVLKNDANGIGLFRSECVYLENEDYPTEEQQFEIYKFVAQKMEGKRVIIRTLDIGADKQVDYFCMPKEENPAMGVRAIRICLTRKEIFKTQLKALLRASAFGKIAIMFPMIISTKEVYKIKEIVNECKLELDNKKIDYDKNIELGIMIETPASVIISDKLAELVDFFSIGTNDLTQYTEAIDRQNPSLEDFFDPHHLAILRMIKLVADNAHKKGKWVGICGELASDQELTEMFVAMGIDELSVSPSSILPLRKIIRECNADEIKEKNLLKLI